MKLPSTLIKHAIAFVSPLIFASAFSSAAQVDAPANGDIFAGFRASTGTGANYSYLINLGSYASFAAVAPGTSIDVINVGADLSADSAPGGFGTSWNSRNNLFWGVFGTDSRDAISVYGSRPRSNVSTPSAMRTALNSTQRTNTASAMGSVIAGGTGAFNVSEATANSTKATYQFNDSIASSYNFQVSGNNDFGTLNAWSTTETNFNGGVASKALDLYAFPDNSTVIRVGYFTINSVGLIRFTREGAGPSPDTDGDGFTDAQEILAGTQPNNASDFFRIENLVKATGSNASFSFKTVVGRSYTIQYSLALTGWQNIRTYNEVTANTVYSFVEDAPERTGESKGFYRVIVSQ